MKRKKRVIATVVLADSNLETQKEVLEKLVIQMGMKVSWEEEEVFCGRAVITYKDGSSREIISEAEDVEGAEDESEELVSLVREFWTTGGEYTHGKYKEIKTIDFIT